MADASEYGWMTVAEYMGCSLAENEGNSRKMEHAEKKAAKKVELKKNKNQGVQAMAWKKMLTYLELFISI